MVGVGVIVIGWVDGVVIVTGWEPATGDTARVKMVGSERKVPIPDTVSVAWRVSG